MMRKLLIAMLASSAVAGTVPAVAFAHDESGYGSDNDNWNNGGSDYRQFEQEYQHIWQGIQHGLGDGSLTRRQAYQFYREMRYIRARADWQERSGNYDSEDIQARLESLHERMHIAHARGHERM